MLRYVTVLKDEKVSASTIINNLGWIAKYVNYVKEFHGVQGLIIPSIPPSFSYNSIVSRKLMPTIQGIQKGMRKERRKIARIHRNQRDLEGEKSWPKGGFKDLQKILKRFHSHQL